jgi:hypothetical protein
MKDIWFQRITDGIRRNGEWLERMDQVMEMEIFTPMVGVVPEGRRGDACVEHFEVREAQSNLSAMIAQLSQENKWWEYVPPGRYARLTIGGKLFMTDSLFEKFAALPFIDNARGDVLVTGLGLGMVVPPLLATPELKSLTIIEKNPDVIDLVETPLRNFVEKHWCASRRLTIECADAYLWDGGDKKYDTIFHDIWPTVNPANLMLFRRVEARYARWLSPGGWQDCWSKELCELKARDLHAEVRAALGGDVSTWPEGARKALRGWAL